MNRPFYTFFLLCLFFSTAHASLVCEEECDLEDIAQEFVLESRQIIIPKYPHAFNPSIVRWEGKLLLSFRIIKNDKEVDALYSSAFSHVGLIWLDDEFRPVGEAQILSLDNEENDKFFSRSEDARLIAVGKELYLTYSSNKDKIATEGGFRMYVARLYYDGVRFQVKENECLTQFDREDRRRREKNWVPFEYCGNLFLAYMLSPHRILRPLLDGTGACETIFTSKGSIVWEWGELRGGTPAILDEEAAEYLAFFHSSQAMATVHSSGETIPHYFMGAYTFSCEPPFAIMRISPEPIIGAGFYHGTDYEPYWHPVRVVFPCGYFLDGQYVWITYGRQDHELWVVKIEKKALLESLIQVTTLTRD